MIIVTFLNNLDDPVLPAGGTFAVVGKPPERLRLAFERQERLARERRDEEERGVQDEAQDALGLGSEPPAEAGSEEQETEAEEQVWAD